MPRSSRLTLIIPNMGRSTASGRDDSASENLPLLSRLGTRGERKRAWRADHAADARHETWQRALLGSLQLSEEAHPSAAITAIGLGAGCGNGVDVWHATPIHLAAGLNEVALVPLDGELALTQEEIDAMLPTVKAHLEESQLQVHRAENDWLIESASAWKFESVAIPFASSHDWNTVLPTGADAGRLRRLLTELQMVLHDHPVNVQRARRGLPSANAVWIWGNGRIDSTDRGRSAYVVGDRAFVRGLRTLYAFDGADDAQAGQLLEKMGAHNDVIAVIRSEQLRDLESQWLQPVTRALKQGLFDTVQLVVDEWEITINRSQLRRFWKRDVAARQWLFA